MANTIHAVTVVAAVQSQARRRSPLPSSDGLRGITSHQPGIWCEAPGGSAVKPLGSMRARYLVRQTGGRMLACGQRQQAYPPEEAIMAGIAASDGTRLEPAVASRR